MSWPTETDYPRATHKGLPRNIKPIDEVNFGANLQPTKYEIFGTPSESKILFLDVNILDSTGRAPYQGDVLIEGERISHVGEVPNVDSLKADNKVRVFHGNGRTLMSGLGDAHTHFTWNGGDLNALGEMNVEEHTLLTMRSAQCYIDSGYTMYVQSMNSSGRIHSDSLQVFRSRFSKETTRYRDPGRHQRWRHPRPSVFG